MPAQVASTLTLSSPAFEEGDPMPARFTRAGGNVSPPLSWRGAPQGTESFVLTFERDEKGTTSTHWLLYDIPAGTTSVGEGMAHGQRLPDGVPQGRNDYGNLGYDGPRPEEGHHAFTFTLYAVDKRLSGIGARMNLAEIHLLMRDHVLATAKLHVTCQEAR